MTQYIFANNVNTSLFAAITSTATSLTLLSATNLPTLAAGQIMPLTLNDKATRTIFEIVYVTAISGTNLTVIRGQEGTAAQNWNAGDYAFSTQTALATELAIQSGAYNYATDTGTTANAYVVTLTPAIPATIPDGFPLTMYVTPARANTGAATLNGVSIVDTNGNAPLAYQLHGTCSLKYSTAFSAWEFLGSRNYLSATDAGAKGNGTTDNTAILNALETLNQEIYLPVGTFNATTKRNASLYYGPGTLSINGFIQPTKKTGQNIYGENLLTNTQWLVCTALSPTTKYNQEGTGTLPAINISSYTTGSNTVTCTVGSGGTSELQNGDLVQFSSTADANLKITFGRVSNLIANTSFQVQCPLGLSPTTSAACTATPQMMGDTTGSTGAGPDGWSKTVSLSCWRDNFSVNSLSGEPYQVGLMKQATTAEDFYYGFEAVKVPLLVGKTLAFGCSVLHKINAGGTGYWQPFVAFNGTGGTTIYGPKSTGATGIVEWGEVTAAIPANATSVSVGIAFNGSISDVAYIGQCISLANCPYIGPNNYYPPVRELLIPVVKISPISWNGASITFPSTADAAGTYSFGFQVDAETNGAIMPTVRKLQFQIEGVNSNAASTGTTSRVIAFRDDVSPPIKYAVIMGQQVADVKTFANGEWTMNPGQVNNGIVYGTIASDSWFNVSIDISGITLN